MNGAEVIAGRFAIIRSLARGNMGQVCEALDDLTGEKVAVKTMLRRRNGELVSLREADKNALRFQREVRIMSRLHSDNLPRIIDGGLDGDQPYLAMEYVPGMTLADLIFGRPLTIDDEKSERIGPSKGIPIFGIDALSSAAYGPEAAMTLLIPLGNHFGIDPIHLGIIFLTNMELGFLAPPVGLNLLLASYRFNKPMTEVMRAVLPMLGVQFVGVLLITYIKPLTTWLPHLVSK